jgi:acetate kinase
MNILVINSGSSSLKYQLFEMPAETPICSGLVERIGIEGSYIKHNTFKNNLKFTVELDQFITDHSDGLKLVLQLLTEGQQALISDLDEIAVVAHRVVHGGEFFKGATVIDDTVKTQIRSLFSLAPLHNKVSYTCIEVAEETFPNATQIAVFDTSFHQTLPEYAYRYAIPKSYYLELGIRTYGFHGTSHKYVGTLAAAHLNKPDAKLISIHLGNGCSMSAIKEGKSIDTTMGFGPLSGLMMGTRSGDIDPSVIFHLLDQKEFTPEKVNTLLNKESGLLGVGGSNDMRDIHKLAGTGDADAKLALQIYAYRIKKMIGAYIAVLNGADAILFTAGVGENDSQMRASVCKDMEYLNIILDEEKNLQYKGGVSDISAVGSKMKILVVPTNEEYEMASQCFNLRTTQ